MRQSLTAVTIAVTLTGSGLANAATPALSNHDLLLLNRLTWGVSTRAAADLAAVGSKRWLDGQLHPRGSDQLPSAVAAQIDALPISHEPMPELVRRMDAQIKAANLVADPDQRTSAQRAYQLAMKDLAHQAAARSLLRDLYSSDQLNEQLTWFWFNHFNVYQYKSNLLAMVGDYEDVALRPRALGDFRDLLEATLRHPAMLRYLDNDQNAVGHINENYAREIMELHTMGVGSGYTQKDVQELARILTGVGIRLSPDTPKLAPENRKFYIRDGLFEFDPSRHDFGDKVLLGHVIKGAGFSEVEQALDILAREPATAHHISLKLATYFMQDDPPPAVVERMSAVFLRSHGNIAATLGALFSSREFDASLGKKFKDPAHYVISGVRMAYGDRVILSTEPIQGWLNRLGEGLYDRQTPDGYPLTADAWSGPGDMNLRFDIAGQLGSGPAGLLKPRGATKNEPGFPQAQNALYYEKIGAMLAPTTRAALDNAISPQDWNTLFFSSPDFMFR